MPSFLDYPSLSFIVLPGGGQSYIFGVHSLITKTLFVILAQVFEFYKNECSRN